MKTLQIINSNENKDVCTTRTRVYTGENNELIFRKTYVGDWGDWDEKSDNAFKDQNHYLDQNTTFVTAV